MALTVWIGQKQPVIIVAVERMGFNRRWIIRSSLPHKRLGFVGIRQEVPRDRLNRIQVLIL